MKKRFFSIALAMILCCTAMFVMAGCEESGKCTLEVTAPTSCNRYVDNGTKTESEYKEEIFVNITVKYTNPNDTTKSWTANNLEEFRAKGGVISVNLKVVGKTKVIFRCEGVSVEYDFEVI